MRESKLVSEERPEDIIDMAIKDILTPGSPHSFSVITFIQRTLHQFHLSSAFEAHDIVTEAYLRGKAALQNGKEIYNPHAWLRRVSFNIIREKRRKLPLQHCVDQDALDFLSIVSNSNGSWIDQDVIYTHLLALEEAFRTLKKNEPDGAYLLQLKVIQGMSWQEIRQYLIEQDGDAPSKEALRQKACRAKKLLRCIFHQVESST